MIADILIVVLIGGAVTAILIKKVKELKAGKTGGCAGCTGCAGCMGGCGAGGSCMTGGKGVEESAGPKADRRTRRRGQPYDCQRECGRQ